MAEQGEYNLPTWAELESDMPKNNFAALTQVPGEEWLPKTDWSRDGIIANDD